MTECLGGVGSHHNALVRIDEPPGEHVGEGALAAEAEHVRGGSSTLLVSPALEHALDTAKRSIVTRPSELRRRGPASRVLAP